MTKLSNSQYSLCEAVSDISMSMGHYGFRYPDSRVSVSKSIEWAEEFEKINRDREWDGEYIDAIDAFSVKKMKEAIASEGAAVEKPLP